jgi:hypothetical protein
MEDTAPASTAGRLMRATHIPARRRILRGALALLGLSAIIRLLPAVSLVPGEERFVIIDGWVLPARFFRG